MAHKKGVGSSRNGRESHSKRLGVKRAAGQSVRCGNIIVKQRGTHILPGRNVKRAGDDSIFAVSDGFVKFETRKGNRKVVSVVREV